MRVLHILWTGHIGGKERAVFQLVRSQMTGSHFRPAFAFGQAEGFYVEEARKLGCPVVDLKMRNGRDFIGAMRQTRVLDQFEVHHFHSAELPLILASMRCGEAYRCYTHRAGMHHPPLFKRLSYRLMGLIFKRGFHGISANTRHGAMAGAQITGVTPDRWAVTYNGMDFDLLTPCTNPEEVAREFGILRGKRIIIGTTAHLRRWKRMDLLIEACAKLAPDTYQLLIVGDGPDRARLEELTKTLGINGQVVFTGMQKRIADFLAVMDVFALPSGPGESFGNSAIEALGVGLPTIVFHDGGGLIEHVENGKTGFIVESVDELAQRLAQLTNDPGLRETFGRTALAHTREKYSIANMTRVYDQFYLRSLGGGAADRASALMTNEKN